MIGLLEWLLDRLVALGILLGASVAHAYAFRCGEWTTWADVAKAVLFSYVVLMLGAFAFAAYRAKTDQADRDAGVK